MWKQKYGQLGLHETLSQNKSNNKQTENKNISSQSIAAHLRIVYLMNF